MNSAAFICCGIGKNFDDYRIMQLPKDINFSLGVHYFGDILVGVLWGLLVGISLYFVWHRWVCDNIASSSTARTGMITSGGYQVNDVMWLTFSILLTYMIIIIISFLPLF